MPWTRFWDMRSGGGIKEPPYHSIYIEAAREEAEIIFYNRFGHSANRVTCTCCGEDYVIYESPTLEQATAFHRGCKYDEATDLYLESGYEGRQYATVEEYIERPNVLVISASEIKPHEREN